MKGMPEALEEGPKKKERSIVCFSNALFYFTLKECQYRCAFSF